MSTSTRCLVTLLLLLSTTVRPAAGAAGPDAFGYRVVASTDPDGPQLGTFLDIATTGTQVTFFDADALPDAENANADDGVTLDLPLTSLNRGLGFPYYGNHRPTVHMGTNGFLTFELNGAADSLSNNCPLQNAAEPNDIIAVLWDDLVLRNPPSTVAGGYQKAFDPCPYAQGGTGACVVFQWDKADHFGGGIDAFTFQAALYDSGNILMLYPASVPPLLNNPEAGSGSTTGLESAGSVFSLTHACDAVDSIPPDSAVLFLAPPIGAQSIDEHEVNDVVALATPLGGGQCGAGILDAESDHWVLSNVPEGDTVYALVDAPFTSAPTSPILELIANDGTTTVARDGDPGPAAGAAITGAVVPQAGDVFMRLTSDVPIGQYGLLALTASPGDFGRELEPNGQTASPIVAAVTTATLATDDDVDLFSFATTTPGDAISILVDRDPTGDGVLTAVLVELLDPDGVVLATALTDPIQRTTVLGRFVPTTTGTHSVRVTGTTGDYDLVVFVNCSVACTDVDADGTCDGVDNCRGLANDQTDTDTDGTGDACDACERDAAKAEPGICGCDVADDDANDDGVVDCQAGVELVARIDRLEDTLRTLVKKDVRRKQPSPLIAEALAQRDDVTDLLRADTTLLLSADATALVDTLERTVTQTVTTGTTRFGKKRTRALAALQAIRAELAPVE